MDPTGPLVPSYIKNEGRMGIRMTVGMKMQIFGPGPLEALSLPIALEGAIRGP